jgi:hypothetical protein
MADVDDAFARDEGEGFTDAADWRAAHERFFGSYFDELRARLGDPDWVLDDDTLIVCQRFRLVERYPEPVAWAALNLHRGANNWHVGRDLAWINPNWPHRLHRRANSVGASPLLPSCLHGSANPPAGASLSR